MSKTAIESTMFHTTGTFQRVSRTLNSVGDASRTWSTYRTEAVIIRPAKVTEKPLLIQGKEYKFDAKGWVAYSSSNPPLNGDRLVDGQSGKTYEIIGVEAQFPANSAISSGHHVKLYLVVRNDTKA